MFNFWGGNGNTAFAIPVDASGPDYPTQFSGTLVWDPILQGFYYSGAMAIDRTTGDISLAGNLNIPLAHALRVNAQQVVAARQTGWGVPTGTLTRTTFATSTVTLPQLAERVAALITDLQTHGLIGA